MDSRIIYLLIAAVAAFFSGVLVQKLNIRLAALFHFYAQPDHRRRHEKETPTIGGVGVLVSWFIGMGVYAVLDPSWISEHWQSNLTLGVGVFALHFLGLWDDIKRLSAYPKLIIQAAVAAFVISYEPNVHSLLMHWEKSIGLFSWVFGFLWVVGITNSINLIDGLDGLAASFSILAAISILILLVWTGDYAANASVNVALLIPALFAFLVFNWNPAKVFLGDNGSLPIGLMLSSASLMGYAQTKSYVLILSLVLIFGYPILDMSMCVLRRYRKNQAIFKGDRAHLHFRITKLGLTVRQTAGLLIVIGAYLQISAIAVNLLEPPAAILGLTVVFFSIFTLLFIIRSIENWRVGKVFSYLKKLNHKNSQVDSSDSRWTLTIDLIPILEKSTNKIITQEIIQSLEILLRMLKRDSDFLFLVENKFLVVFDSDDLDEDNLKKIESRFKESIGKFVELFNVESTTATIPVEIKRQTIFLPSKKRVKNV